MSVSVSLSLQGCKTAQSLYTEQPQHTQPRKNKIQREISKYNQYKWRNSFTEIMNYFLTVLH